MWKSSPTTVNSHPREIIVFSSSLNHIKVMQTSSIPSLSKTSRSTRLYVYSSLLICSIATGALLLLPILGASGSHCPGPGAEEVESSRGRLGQTPTSSESHYPGPKAKRWNPQQRGGTEEVESSSVARTQEISSRWIKDTRFDEARGRKTHKSWSILVEGVVIADQ